MYWSGEVKYGIPYTLRHERFEHPAGTVVYRQSGYDYGLSNDDSRVTGIEHVTMTLNSDGGYPGFTVPVHAIGEIPK